MKLDGLKPEKVFEFFELISSVPHGSDNIWQISNLLCDFAKQRGLDWAQDAVGNVIIRKAGTTGYEDHPTVILQGHMDMVAVKNADCDLDMEREGLRLMHDDEYVWADGTSLGGDDGIAVAMGMALLDSDSIQHPPIELVVTVNEETGMDGAVFIDPDSIKGRMMLNIDSEDEGIITVGCAGGERVYGSFELCPERMTLPTAVIELSGLTGGHSGAEIQKGRANACILMGRLLNRLMRKADLYLISIDGGEKDNAIANACTVRLAYDGDIAETVSACAVAFRAEYANTDPGLRLRFTDTGVQEAMAGSLNATEGIIFVLSHAPNGVQVMSTDIEGLVQTSLNLGVIATENDTVSMTFCLRSSVSTQKEHMVEQLTSLIEYVGGTVETGSAYPAWEFRKNSPLRDVAVSAFEALYGRKPEISVIHAGLECGLFSEKLPGLDAISFGPDMQDIHTAKEKLSSGSTERTWAFLLERLKML